MDKLISKLTGEQALAVVRRLTDGSGVVADAVVAEARKILADVDIDEVAEDVFLELDFIRVEDCWDRAGASRDGYKDEIEAATELVEEELRRFFDQVDRYHDLGMLDQERDYCKGMILGAYRYTQESESEFKDRYEDIPIDGAGFFLDEWRKREANKSALTAMDDFIQERCPAWTKYLVKKQN